ASADLDAVVRALLALSDMACDLAEIVELDINPLLADQNGVLALDARVVVRKPRTTAEARLAIRPYPRELENVMQLEDGAHLPVRPLKPEDAPAIIAFGKHTSSEDLRLRFHGAPREISQDI